MGLFGSKDRQKKTTQPAVSGVAPYNHGVSHQVSSQIEPYETSSDYPAEYSEGAVMVSTCDIFGSGLTGQADREVLLVREGTEVDEELFDTLVKFGADPGDFAVKQLPESFQPAQSPAAKKNMAASRMLGHSDPLFQSSSAVKAIRHNKRVMVLDNNHKSLNRVMDCLVHCGYFLGRIHPVRQSQQMLWALQKYQPDILLIDYELSDAVDGLQLVKQALTEYENYGLAFEQVVLMIPPSNQFLENPDAFLNEVERLGIDVILKPVNRFNLNRILTPIQ